MSALLSALAVALGARTDATPSKLLGVFGLWIGFVGVCVIAAHRRGSRSTRADFGLTFRLRDVPIGLVAGVAAQLALAPAVTWPWQRLVGGDVNGPARELLGEPALGRWVIASVVIIGAPVVEELFFRGLLLRSIARYVTDVVAVALSSAVFAATHYQVLQFPGLMVAGLVFATLVWRTGRLGPAIVAHAAFNAAGVLVVVT